jgi:Flp pilus assembly protein CpaB
MELTQRQPAGSDWRRWLSTRQGIVVVAVVSALLAAGIIAYALSQYRHSLNSGSEREDVLVATRLIEKGTAGDAIGVGQFFKPTSIVAKQATTGAFIDAAQLHGKIAIADIYPGQQLTASDFSPAGGELVSKLAASQRAISVPLEGAHGLIGHVQVGDHVDVYASFSLPGGAGSVLRLLAPNVEVLNAGQQGAGASLGNNQANAVNNVILEVNTRQAAKVAFAVDNGKVWLTLRPGNGISPDQQPVNLTSILAGSPDSAQEGKQ